MGSRQGFLCFDSTTFIHQRRNCCKQISRFDHGERNGEFSPTTFGYAGWGESLRVQDNERAPLLELSVVP